MGEADILTRSLEYPASGRVRSGTLYRCADTGEKRRAVVVIHGLFVDRRLPEIDIICRALAPSFDMVSVDMRGHGEGPGVFTWGREEHRDVADLVAFLRSLYPRVGVLGFSFGGDVAIFSAALARGREDDARPDALCTVGSPAHLDLWRFRVRPFACLPHVRKILLRRRRRFVPGWPRLRWRRAVDVVGGVSPVPLLIAHGDRDWLVHPDHARQLFEAAGAPRELLIVKGGLHAEFIVGQDPGLLARPVGRFFETWLSQEAPAASASGEVRLRRDRS